MPLLVVIALVVSLGSAEWIGAACPLSAAWTFLLTGLLSCAVVLAAFVGALRWAGSPRLKTFERMHALGWFGAVLLIMLVLNWPAVIRSYWDKSFLIDECLILLPVFLPLLCSWIALGIGATANGSGDVLGTRLWQASKRALARAQGELAPVLAPALVMLIVFEVITCCGYQAENENGGWIVYAATACLLLLGLPWLLSLWWPTQPLEAGELKSRLTTAATDLGVSLRRIRIWRSDAFANAMVCGVGPLRTVFLTTGLLDSLTEDQVEAVFRHEAAHVRHGHAASRMLTAVLPLLAYLAAWKWVVACCGHPDGWIATTLYATVGFGTTLYLIKFFGWVAHRFEHEADLSSTRDRTNATATLIGALRTLASDSGESRTAAGWLHPSLHEREKTLLTVDADDWIAANRRLRWMLVAAAIFLLGAMVYPLPAP